MRRLAMFDPADPIVNGSQWFVPKPLIEKSIESQLWILAIVGALALLSLVYVVAQARAVGRPYPIYIWVGGILALFYEPLGDLFAHVTYQEVNQLTLISSFGFRDPLWVLPAYILFVGAPVVWNLRRIERGVTMTAWAWGYIACVASAFLFEAPLIELRYFEYYGPQPLAILGYPVWMAFVNAASFMFVTPTLLHLLNRTPIGIRWPSLYIVLTPMIAIGAHAAASLPIGFAHNSAGNSMTLNLGALLSTGLALLQVWVCGRLITSSRR